MKNLTLVIPAKNEKESLPHVINEIKHLKCKKMIILTSDDLDTINAIKNIIYLINQINTKANLGHQNSHTKKLP